jgi:N-methylhydantoinase B
MNWVDGERDPFRREIVHYALSGIAEECGIVTARSAYSPSVNEAPDIACALFDSRARIIAQTRGALIHVSALRSMLPQVLEEHPPGSLRPGDVIICNDVFRGGIHPTDVGVFRPIFHSDTIAFYYAALMIVSDLGGLSTGGLPANASECFHEGLMIPALRLFTEGRLDRSILRMIQANSRTPQRVGGDILALVAGSHLAVPRLVELMEIYGRDVLEGVMDELMDYAEHLARRGIAAIPDGVYHGSYMVEEDGVEAGRTHPVKVTLTIDGSSCLMDFTGTGPRARGAINSTWSQSMSACIYALRCYMDSDVPWNEGIYRPLEVVFPPGSLVNAQYPAATNIRMAVVHAMMDSIFQALGAAFPDRIVAPAATPFVFTVSGASPEDGTMWSLLDLNLGTMGARAGKDGIDGASALVYSQSPYGRSIEAFEWQYPVVYRYHRLGRDSGGAGRWRGGCGVVKQVEFQSDAELTVRAVDRCSLPPLGVAGGRPGKPGRWIIDEGRETERDLRPKETNVVVKAGQTLTAIVPGGGGLGDPRTRDPSLVARDVRSGRVSPEAALAQYGVVADAAGIVDVEATARYRHPS